MQTSGTFPRFPDRPRRRRALDRKQVNVCARIFAPDVSSSVDCVVRDISPGGTQIEITSGTSVPDRIYLWQEEIEAMVHCEVRWRRGNLVGLSFVDSDQRKVHALVARCMPSAEKIVAFGMRSPAL
jgi:hypothetical protein